MNPLDIKYETDAANGAASVHFILTKESISDDDETNDHVYYDHGEAKETDIKRILFEIATHPAEVIREYEKVIKFLKEHKDNYPYAQISIDGASGDHDGLEWQPLHGMPINSEYDKESAKYSGKEVDGCTMYNSSLIQRDESVLFQIEYLQTRIEIFKALFKDSLNPESYEDMEELRFGFVWYAD